jgi:hypothetical protein
VTIRVNFSALRSVKWHEYGTRFLFGGLVTVVAGLIARKFGPATGGLFLAFPAIFPASATLVEKHETEKKKRANMHGAIRGREAAGLDAAGAALGSIGLAAFAIIAWRLLLADQPIVALGTATAVWLVVSVLAWRMRRTL